MLLDSFSSWDCNAEVCGITGPCPACLNRQRIEQILETHGHQLRPCRIYCTLDNPCEECRDVQQFLGWIFRRKNRVATMLKLLGMVAKAFPDEWRELLAPAVLDIMEEAQQ